MRLPDYFEHGYDPKTLTVRQIMKGSVLVGIVSEFDLLKMIDEGKDLRRVTADK
jgi:hypothetical protein